MRWMDETVEQEKKYMAAIAQNLCVIADSAKSNQALEELYAGFYAAYRAGMEELASLEKEVNESHPPSSENKAVAAWYLTLCARCLNRPSDRFRAYLREQQHIILVSMSKLLQDGKADAAYIEAIGSILCSFEVPPAPKMSEEEEPSMFGGLAKLALVAGGSFFLGRSSTDYWKTTT